MIKKILLNTVKYMAVSVIWIGIWQIVAVNINESLLFPGPLSVSRRIIELITSPEAHFFKTIWHSFSRIIIGMGFGVLIGALGGICTAFSKTAKVFFAPILAIIKSTPVASFILLLVLWVNRDNTALVIAAMMVIPIVWTNIESGILNTDRALTEMAKMHGTGIFKMITKIYLPSIIPYFTAALRSSLGMAWKAGIAAEVLLQPAVSIGKMIFGAKLMLETVDLFAWTAVVIILSVIIEKFTVVILKAILKKYSASQTGGVLLD